jgi:hypothetical protein
LRRAIVSVVMPLRYDSPSLRPSSTREKFDRLVDECR